MEKPDLEIVVHLVITCTCLVCHRVWHYNADDIYVNKAIEEAHANQYCTECRHKQS